ncbi:hypothetical protein V5O48_007595 [Marasmius crinis-equi]|uniref:Cytochrome P450 n=1 Tax=Marasmius crinis-equi TaxID=585013 RepID=A0ABR3FG62_9AGAR
MLFSTVKTHRIRIAKLDTIPSVGHDGLLSWISAYKFVNGASSIMKEGYDRFPSRAFKVPLMDRWMVVVSGPEMLEDIRKAAEHQLSLREAFNEAKIIHHTTRTLFSDSTFGKALRTDPYHVNIIRGTLTRSIGNRFPEVREEMMAAFKDEIPVTDEWTKVPMLQKTLRIVCRTSNRLFVGSALCRDEEWKAINIEYTAKVFLAGQRISVCPKIFQPIVTRLINPLPAYHKRALKRLMPTIQDRLEERERDEDWKGPDDLLTWLINGAKANEKGRLDPYNLVCRMMAINFAAIHTTAFTNALYTFASHAEYMEPIRHEMEKCIQEDGWSKAAMSKMRMLDSFLKESQRCNSSRPFGVVRMAMENFTFSDGTVVPAGTLICTSPKGVHFDEKNYPEPNIFDPMRFYHMREREGESTKHQMVAPEASYLSFGAGKNACPGRFFAVNELKLLLTHTLLNYDIKFDESEEDRPKRTEFAGRLNPDRKTQLMFRKRDVAW